MSMSRDAPVGPTCPIIDSVIANLKDALKAAESTKGYLEELDFPEDSESIKDTIAACLVDLDAVISGVDLEYELEELRDANDKLRSWGNKLVEELQEFEEEVEDLNGTIDGLGGEIYSLNHLCNELRYDNESLKRDISAKNNEITDLNVRLDCATSKRW